MRNNQQFHTRNKEVRQFVDSLLNRFPHWKYDYIMEKAAERFFLSKRTVEAIVKGEGIYVY